MNKVVKLRVNIGNLEDMDSTLTKQVRAFINAKMRDYIKNGGKIKDLLTKCGNQVKTYRTISRLAYYETTRPHWRTVMAVCEALEIMEELGNMIAAYGKKRKSH